MFGFNLKDLLPKKSTRELKRERRQQSNIRIHRGRISSPRSQEEKYKERMLLGGRKLVGFGGHRVAARHRQRAENPHFAKPFSRAQGLVK